MRTALVLSGQPRFWRITYEHFYKHLIEFLKCDVFFHTWWSPDMIGTLYPCAMHARRALRQEDLLVSSTLREELLETYKPRACSFEDYKDVKPLRAGYKINYQYYSQWEAKRITAIFHPSYDLFIRSRFDLMVQQDIPFVLDNNLWVSSACPYNDGIRYNDMFSFSNWENFNDVSNTYLNIHKFENEGDGKADMEYALGKQIKLCGINVKTFLSDYSTFDILRSSDADKYR